MNRAALITEMQRSRLVAVVRSKTPEDALALAQAAIDGGVKFVEITFSVPGAPHVIKNLSGHPDAHVGAGTVLSKKQAEATIGAGAKFIVSPTLELDLIPMCHEANIACFPGAATPTEILTAARAGAELVKIFPADLVGGVDFIRQMVWAVPRGSLHGVRRSQSEQRQRLCSSGGDRYLPGERVPGQLSGAARSRTIH